MGILIDIGIILTYFMVGVAALTAIGFGIKKMVEKPDNATKTLYTIGGLIAIILFAYLFASDEVLKSFEKYEISKSTSKQVGMGLITFYLLIAGAVGAVIYSEFSKVFSK